jgi:hypothetical protein
MTIIGLIDGLLGQEVLLDGDRELRAVKFPRNVKDSG